MTLLIFEKKILAKMPTFFENLLRLLFRKPSKQDSHSLLQETLGSPTFLKKYSSLDEEILPTNDVADVINNIISDIGDYTTASEAIFGIDYRDPTADRNVIEFCQAIPLHLFQRGFRDRLLVREGMKKYLPAKLRWRKTRGAQVADWYLKFDAELTLFHKMNQSLNVSALGKYFDVKSLNNLLQNWQPPDHNKENYLSYKFLLDYRWKFSRGMTTYTYLSQLHQFAQRKEALHSDKKLAWQRPTLQAVY